MKEKKIKELTTTGMLCALAYAAAVFGRIPLVLFLKYDSKDVIIVMGGLLFGPMTSFAITVIVSVIQMVTVSGTGIIGCIMNILSSCAFACIAAYFYRKKRSFSGAAFGLFCGWGCQVVVMTLWNYLIAPVYMGYLREEIVALLFSAFIPFNLVKGGLNAALAMILYKPVITVLQRLHWMEES